MKLPRFVDLTCKQVTEIVTDYMADELAPEDVACFEQHLHACTWCMTYLQQMRRTVEWTRELARPSAPDSVAALSELFRRWNEERK